MTNLELRARTAPRNISVDLDPIDCIYVVAALAEMEDRWQTTFTDVPISLTGRAERVRRVRIAIERAVYGEPTEGGIEQYQSESR